MKAGVDERLYWVWAAMIQRCHNPNNRGYRLYGARGISVCGRWRTSVAAFASDMGPRPAGCSIDRIDGSRGYAPDNCRWATRQEQNANRSWCRYINVAGDRLTMKEAWRRHAADGVTYRAFVKRIVTRGWDAGLALATPPARSAA
jgi:hypothetical protein